MLPHGVGVLTAFDNIHKYTGCHTLCMLTNNVSIGQGISLFLTPFKVNSPYVRGGGGYV